MQGSNLIFSNVRYKIVKNVTVEEEKKTLM